MASTFDNLADTVSFDRQSKFFKPDTIRKVPPNDLITKYYESREPAYLTGMDSMGVFHYSSIDDLWSKIEKLRTDSEFWRQEISRSLEVVDSRANSSFLLRVLLHNLSSRAANLTSLRQSSPLYGKAWNAYLN